MCQGTDGQTNIFDAINKIYRIIQPIKNQTLKSKMTKQNSKITTDPSTLLRTSFTDYTDKRYTLFATEEKEGHRE
jgi:hypothetical protein